MTKPFNEQSRLAAEGSTHPARVGCGPGRICDTCSVGRGLLDGCLAVVEVALVEQLVAAAETEGDAYAALADAINQSCEKDRDVMAVLLAAMRAGGLRRAVAAAKAAGFGGSA